MKIILSLKTWLVIYPSITVFYYFFGDQLLLLPLYARTFFLTITLVPWMTFVGIPLLNAVLQFFSAMANKHK